MSNLADMARDAAEIADDAGDDFAAMTADQLATMAHHLRCAVMASGAVLVQQCGGDQVAARRYIKLALELPASVVKRAAASAGDAINAGDLPTVGDLAAHTALLMRNVELMDLRIEQRGAGPAN